MAKQKGMVAIGSNASYGDVLRRYRKQAGFSQTELSRTLGVSCSVVSNWENGIARPDLDHVRTLCHLLNMPAAEFLSVRLEAELSAQEHTLIRDYRAIAAPQQRLARALIHTMAAESAAVEPAAAPAPALHTLPRPVIHLPLLELGASAGPGVYLDAEVGSTDCPVAASPMAEEADALIRVSGNSMEPRFYDGDLLYVKYEQSLSFGQIGIFVADGEGLVKRYERDGLHSFNPAYATRTFRDFNDVRLIGRVLGVVSPDEMP